MILDRKAFEQRVYKLRIDTGLTTRKFEKKVTNMTNWYSYEHGRCLPGVETTNAICEALNVNIQWFLTGEGIKKRSV